MLLIKWKVFLPSQIKELLKELRFELNKTKKNKKQKKNPNKPPVTCSLSKTFQKQLFIPCATLRPVQTCF